MKSRRGRDVKWYVVCAGPYIWFKAVTKAVAATLAAGAGWEFVCCDADASLYRRHTTLGDFMYMLVYVDDFKLAGPQGCAELHTCVQHLKETIGERVLCAEACFIGFKMTHNRKEGTLLLSQPKYTRKLLANYGMQDANACRTPMDSKLQLQEIAIIEEACTIEPYASLVGGLMFRVKCTRPDIAQAVHVLARFMANPRCSHWLAAKRVLCYLAGTVEWGLLFGGRGEREAGSCDRMCLKGDKTV
jgi:hypothetical protein